MKYAVQQQNEKSADRSDKYYLDQEKTGGLGK